MKLQKTLIAAGLALLALQANAQSFSSMAAGPGNYAAPVFTTATPAFAYTSNNSVYNVRLEPKFDTNTYLVVSPGGSATIDLAGATSFSFLWGSPDPYNVITIDGVTFNTTTLLGALANSSNDNTRWATFSSDGVGMHNFTITSTNIAFEMAVANPVPEPETYALRLGGLGALAFVVRRRKV